MEEMGIVLGRKSNDAKPIPVMALHPDWWNERLYEWIDHLGQFRREGKDRREQSVGQRVLGLAERNAPEVVEWTSLDERSAGKL